MKTKNKKGEIADGKKKAKKEPEEKWKWLVTARAVGVASAGRVLTSRHDLSGGKKSDTQMGSNGSSWNTKGRCSRRRTSLFRATSSFTMMVGFLPTHAPGTSSVVARRAVERCPP